MSQNQNIQVQQEAQQDTWRVVDKPVDLPNTKLVEVIAEIRCNETGEVQRLVAEQLLEGDDDAPSNYMWAEGNWSCDCNRRLFFERAKGVPDSLDEARTSGN